MRPSGTSGLSYVGDADAPWMPLTPVSDEVFVKYWKADPLRSETILSIKMPGRVQLPTHHHIGLVVAHTISGAWRCREYGWIAREGDTLCGSVNSVRTLESFEDTEIFVYQLGESVFRNSDGSTRWLENPFTAIDRYNRYCADNGIPPRDLTAAE